MQLDVNTDAAFTGFLPGQPQEDDRSLIVEFFVGKKLMGAKSHEVGREVYEDREFIKIQIKGQDKQVVVEEVTERHRQRFPIAYQAFQHRKPVPVVGTPIEQLPGVGPSQAYHLKGLNLRTVEDVANVTDENTLTRIGMGARDLVKRAQAWLKQSTERSISLEQEVAMLKARLTELAGNPGEAKKPVRKKAVRKATAEAQA